MKSTYDNLIKSLPVELLELSTDEKKDFISLIEEHKTEHDKILALIRIHQSHQDGNTSTPPYSCKWLKTKKGYKFDIDNLPLKLVYIINEFMSKD